MSNIAAEIATRMRDDGIDPSGPGNQVPMVDVPPTETPESARAPVPGDEGRAQPVPLTPPAEAQTTETPVGTEPGPIPYARFKEVNDQLASLRGYRELNELGYDPDSLGRLAAFEAQYLRNPKETIHAMVSELDLPEEAKARIAENLGVGYEAPAGGAPTDDGDGSSALSKEDRELIEWARGERQRTEAAREQAARDQQLDSVVNHWTRKDTEDQFSEVPEHVKLTWISTAAAQGGFTSLEQLAERAREMYVAEQERILGGAVQSSRRSGTPLPALPGSGAPAPAIVPKNFSDANKLARAAMERGELPRISGG